MLLGVVEGAVWGARQASGFSGHKLLRVRTTNGTLVAAVDGLSAGVGDRVLVAHGSRVRDLALGETVPTKDVIVAIVDDFQT